MKTEHVGLWQRLAGYSPDAPGAQLPFSARLAKENGWSPAFTARAIEEYKRFALLAMVAGHPVSPADAVDQVWHLHLTYTQDYWKKFCGEVLGKPLHHHPTEGGPAESAKFDDWYGRTLASYREHFGSEPPRDIWPDPAAKRAARNHFVRVDKAANWVIPRPRLPRAAKVALLAFAFIGLAGCGAIISNPPGPLDWRGPDFLGFYAVFMGVCFAAAAWLRWKLREPSDLPREGGGELDAFEVAYLNEGEVLAVNTALASLIDRRSLKADAASKAVVVVGELSADAHPLEKAVFVAAALPGGRKIADVRQAAKPAVERMVAKLKQSGFVVSGAHARKAFGWPLLIASLVPMLAVIKIMIGASRDKPVGFLIAACAVSVVVVLAGFARWPRRSRRGDAVLAQLRQRRAGLKTLNKYGGEVDFAMGVGLFGMAALAGTAQADLRKTLKPPSDNSSGCGGGCSGGGGGGCGGGGCGGGCGGCGGG